MQDRVEFCVAKVERIMVALESFCAVAKEQGKTFVDPHRCKVAVVTLGGKPKELREKAGGSFLVMCWNDGVVEYNRHHPLLTGFNDLCLADVSAVQCENNADIYDSLNLANLRAGAHQLRQY
jgi:hypothetical protein